jgi:hyperosmotically inducible protein
MSIKRLTSYAAAAGVMVALAGAPARAQQQGSTAPDKDRPATTESAGEKITDAWILTKVKTQFVAEDALKDSNINVDVTDHVVHLRGTVASEAGKRRAAEIARKTDGVLRVENELRVGVPSKDDTTYRGKSGQTAGAAHEAGRDVSDAAHDAKHETKASAHTAKEKTKDTAEDVKDKSNDATYDAKARTKDTARDASHGTREVTGTAGQAVSDGWITTKVKSSFVGVDALDGSDIKVDTNDHVVTLRGTVPTAAARAKAVSLAKKVDGVTSVKDDLTIAPKK